MTQFYQVACGESFDHVNDERGEKTEDQKGMGKPAIERLAKKFFVKDDIPDKNLDIPPWPCPETSPPPLQKDLQLFAMGGVFCPF